MVPTDDGASPAPIDRAVLARMRSLFDGQRTYSSAKLVEDGGLHLRVEVADDYYPEEISATLDIRWYRNDDFTLQYLEHHRDHIWACRWDRHPNPHNAREHFHPPPDATSAVDAEWPDDHRGVCSLVLDRVEARIETLWEQQ